MGKAAMLFRHALVPYLYTASRATFDTAVAAVHPMYYDWPKEPNAYDFADSQYMFGDAILAAPVASAASMGLEGSTIWLPPGTWSSWNASQMVQGPVVLTNMSYALDEIPLFVRAGAVCPCKRWPIRVALSFGP